MHARERWLRWNSGNDQLRLRVGRWHLENERWEQAARYLREANEVDPFRRSLHKDWAQALIELERPEEALRELRVAAAVPPDLDADGPRPMARSERATLGGLRALALLLLGRVEEARAEVTQALELDEDNEVALAAQEELGE